MTREASLPLVEFLGSRISSSPTHPQTSCLASLTRAAVNRMVMARTWNF